MESQLTSGKFTTAFESVFNESKGFGKVIQSIKEYFSRFSEGDKLIAKFTKQAADALATETKEKAGRPQFAMKEEMAPAFKKGSRNYMGDISDSEMQELRKQVENELDSTKKGIANDFIGQIADTLYIIDAGNENGEIAFGVFDKLEFENKAEANRIGKYLKEQFHGKNRIYNKDLGRSLLPTADSGKGLHKTTQGKVLQDSKGKSKDNAGGVLREDGHKNRPLSEIIAGLEKQVNEHKRTLDSSLVYDAISDNRLSQQVEDGFSIKPARNIERFKKQYNLDPAEANYLVKELCLNEHAKGKDVRRRIAEAVRYFRSAEFQQVRNEYAINWFPEGTPQDGQTAGRKSVDDGGRVLEESGRDRDGGGIKFSKRKIDSEQLLQTTFEDLLLESGLS